jgi:hypothetical protein
MPLRAPFKREWGTESKRKKRAPAVSDRRPSILADIG